ncbi:maleylpyruvate isomerase family mycothiol-dependent enzyme [Nakamurella sp. GG22]
MNATATAIGAIRRLERPECTALAIEEFDQVEQLLNTLDGADWSRTTDCPDWDVRAVAGHILGMAQTFSSLRQFLSYMPTAARTRNGRDFIDSLTALQVKRNAGLDTSTLIAEIKVAGAAAARWRSSRRLMRHIPLQQPLPDGTAETWRLGYLLDIILVRDPWMHRVDISRAVGRPLALTPAHDGRIVADVVAEWAGRHGQPFTLRLTGPAGGSYVQSTGGPDIQMDAVEFCRVLSQREPGQGLLAEFVPF